MELFKGRKAVLKFSTNFTWSILENFVPIFSTIFKHLIYEKRKAHFQKSFLNIYY